MTQNAKVKITATLVNPPGVYENEYPISFEKPETFVNAHRQILGRELRDGGLWRDLGEMEHEFIPLLRIKSVNIKFEVETIQLATEADLPATAALAEKITDISTKFRQGATQ